MSKTKAERAVQIAAEILDLRRRLEEKEHELASLFEGHEDAAPSGGPTIARASTFANRVLSVLDASSHPLSAPEIALQLHSAEAVDTIRTTLSKLARSGVIERVTTGHYRSLTGGGHKRASGEDS